MTRTDVIEAIIAHCGFTRYLEIGVYRGANFFPINVKHKTGVDPDFQISLSDKLKWNVKRPCNLFAKYYKQTSDAFFAENRPVEPYEIAFIDGLHTHQQSYQDVLNVLDCLTPEGVIVMHDCHPPHPAAAHPAASLNDAGSMNLPGWNGEWCGDVWKTVCKLQMTRDDLDVFVLDTDYGLGIITRRQSPQTTTYPLKETELAELTYADLAGRKEELLNLKPVRYFQEFLQTLPAGRKAS